MRWIGTFVLVAAVGACWAIADPLFAPADEGSHTIRAAAVARAQIVGSALSDRQTNDLTWGIGGRQGPPATAYRSVRVPAIYDSPAYNCFVFQPSVTPACVTFTGSRRPADVVTAVPRYPPAYYAWVGIVSFPFKAGTEQMYAMRLASVLLMAGLLASAFETIWSMGYSRMASVGLLVALTPQTLFVNGAINPSAMEISAAMALWVSGVALARATPSDLSDRLIGRTAIAAILLVLARHISPLWLALIGLTLLSLTTRSTLRWIAARKAAWIWAVTVAAAVAAALTWILLRRPFSTAHSIYPAGGFTTSEILIHTINAIWTHYCAMIGLFGWSEVAVPSVTLFLWTALLGFLIFLAITFARDSRSVFVLGSAIGVSILAPLVIDSASALANGVGFTWQGRYGLPYAVGVPILAGMLTERSQVDGFLDRRRILLVLGAALVVAQTFAFWQMLRRYTVGLAGPLQFWIAPEWTPPLPTLFLVVAFPLAMMALVWWTLLRGAQPVVGRNTSMDQLQPPTSSPHSELVTCLEELPNSTGFEHDGSNVRISRGKFLAGLGGLAVGVPIGVLGRDYQRPASPAAVAPPNPPGPTESSFAQAGEDIIVNFLFTYLQQFKDIQYLDIGAWHPVTHNNTYFFYRKGFRGVLVEPNPEMCEALRAARPEDTTLEAGIGVTALREADYYMMNQSGWNTFSKDQADHQTKVTGGQIRVEKVTKIPLLNINDVMAKQFGKAPAYVSIDAQGLHLAILKSIDYGRFRPLVICVDTLVTGTNASIPEIPAYMASQGYVDRGGSFVNTIFVDGKRI